MNLLNRIIGRIIGACIIVLPIAGFFGLWIGAYIADTSLGLISGIQAGLIYGFFIFLILFILVFGTSWICSDYEAEEEIL